MLRTGGVMLNKITKLSSIMLAFALIPGLSLAQSAPLLKTTYTVAEAGDKGIPAIGFEAQYLVIQAFIDLHKVSSSYETEALVKYETQHGFSDWSVIGEGLGWPAAATSVGMIVFDSNTNAQLCAQMLHTLAGQQ